MTRLSTLSARLHPRWKCNAISRSTEILDYLRPRVRAFSSAVASGKLTLDGRPVHVTLKYECGARLQGMSALCALHAIPTFFTLIALSPSTETLTLSSLSLSSSSSSLSPVHPAVAGTCRRNLQAAHANVRIPVVVSSRQPQTPRLKMLLVLLRKGARSRSTDIKETFYGRELRNDVYTRRLSDFYERKPDIVLP